MREQLQRVLRTPEVLFIGINGVVGGGSFLLPGQVAQPPAWGCKKRRYPFSATGLPPNSILGNSYRS